jgi:hypothetical protein
MAYSTVTFNGGQPATITFVALHSMDTAPWQFVDLGEVPFFEGATRSKMPSSAFSPFAIETQQ